MIVLAVGFRTASIKAGIDFEGDVVAVRAICERFGPGLGIRVDANMGWRNEKTLLSVANQLTELGICRLNNHSRRTSLGIWPSCVKKAPQPIILDESITWLMH